MSSASALVRDRLGVHPLYFLEDGSAAAGTIAALLHPRPSLPVQADLAGWRRYLAGTPDDRHTCFSGIGLVPAGHQLTLGEGGPQLRALAALPEPRGSLTDTLIESVAAIMAAPHRTALALSGGLDSALVLALVRRALGREIPVFTLAIEIPDYGELEATRRTARELDVELHEIPATAADYLDALPDAVRAVEVPLYNPHPVSKLLLARALAREGFTAVLTGDAADHVFAGAPQHDYLPLVGGLMRSAGIEVGSPFFDPRVLAHALGEAVDPNKQALRRVAARWLPRALAEAPKALRLTPDLGVERLVGTRALLRLAARLGLPPPRLEDPRSRCGYTTSCLLWDALAPESRACAASQA